MIPRFLGIVLLWLGAQCFAANESFLLVLNKADNTLAMVDPTNCKVVARLPTGEGRVIVTNPEELSVITKIEPGNVPDGLAWAGK